MTLFAVAGTLYAVVADELHPNEEGLAYILLIVAMCLWGLSGGVISGPIQALYADSIPTGERSRYYLYLSGCWLLSSCVGPAVAIAVFLTRSNDWTLGELRTVIFVGLSGELVVAFMLFLFRDSKALGRESDHIASLEDPDTMMDEAVKEKIENGHINAGGDRNSRDGKKKKRSIGVEMIPCITFFAGLVTAIGSGMTVKFFPLFFKNDCHMTPAGVQGVYFCAPISIFLFSVFGTKLAATGFGRVQTIMLCKLIGVSALFLMGFLKDYRDRWEIMVPIYLFRTGIMNSTYPMEESILMDFVPKERRYVVFLFVSDK